MLNLKDLRKSYLVGGVETKALDGISLAFREKEFVAILGKSGSGKTTFLNIIGGLDRYSSGEMTIRGKKTAEFADNDWDAYRNNSVGFVFQNYHLIPHQDIVANVALGMTLSGISAAERRQKAVDALERVGLGGHLHKKPNQLSGGEMQRVAIARALAGDPDILLCDEPTGALDTVTSVQIMDLIKELSAERLVIVVTHNPELAEKYADRIINFSDGKVIGDTSPYEESKEHKDFILKKTSMSFSTAMKLSASNLLTKKGRAFLTAFASGIGIIGIAVILSLSTGFQIQVDEFQSDALSEFPIISSRQTALVDMENVQSTRENIVTRGLGTEGAPTDVVFIYDPTESLVMHTNNFSEEFLAYLDAIDPAICSRVGYTRMVNMNLLREVDGEAIPVTMGGFGAGGGMDFSAMLGGMSNIGFSSYPVNLDPSIPRYMESHYDLLAGEYPESETDLVLLIDDNNCLDVNTLNNLGFDTKEKDSIPFDEIIGQEFRLITNDNYYELTDYGTYLPRMDYDAMYHCEGNIVLRITGIIRQKEDNTIGLLGDGLAYSDDLSKLVIEEATSSEIVRAQENSDVNVMTQVELDESAKEQFLSYLGGNPIPFLIMLFPVSFDAKDEIIAYLDAWNASQDSEDVVIYTDLAATITDMTADIMSAITIVLIAFAAIALVVSLIMIAIITYTSVLERTKEIGILRALGARKRDITRVFNAETCILGILSGVLGISIAYGLTIPINIVIEDMTGLADVAQLPVLYAVLLLILSTVLTILGGFIPARMASKKDAVVALRTE